MIPRPLARKIDRLGRRAHAFHRFAHHPLCSAYQGEVVRLGTWRVCRGCLLAALGGAAGVVAGGVLPRAPTLGLALLGLAWLGLLGCAFRYRPGKAITRFLPALLGTTLILQGVRWGNPAGLGLSLAVAAAGFGALRAYRRRGPDRKPCLECPERTDPGTCSGYRPIQRRERAFQRLARRWLP